MKIAVKMIQADSIHQMYQAMRYLFKRFRLLWLLFLPFSMVHPSHAIVRADPAVDSVRIKPNQIPLLTSGINNLAFTIRIFVHPGEDRPFLRSVRLRIDKPGLLRMVKVIGNPYTNKSVEGEDRPFQYLTFGASEPSAELTLEGNLPLAAGENIFYVSLLPVKNADLLSEVKVQIFQLTASGGWHSEPERAEASFRMAKVLRAAGQDDVHTYRIPGLAVTKKGTLIAVYDIRYNNDRDLQDDIDIGMSRSTDGGQTWKPMKVILDMGSYGGIPASRNGTGDPAILVDNQTNTIWVAALWIHGNYAGVQNNRFSQQGLEPMPDGRGSQLILVKSEDDGVSWSKPVNITRQTKNPKWGRFLQGPGCGITMHDGTLVFPAQFLNPGKNDMSSSTIIYSKDHGKTWKTAASAVENGGEAQVVELTDGVLMLNMRSNRKARLVATTRDMGTTWERHPTSELALPEPGCQASLIKSTGKTTKGTREILFFSNPDNTGKRADMTIKASPDLGETWPAACQVRLNENTGYGYSCMTMMDENTVGIVYEGVRELFFQKIAVKDIIKGCQK
jgi:sialidase-1